MNITKNRGMLVLAVYLVVVGICGVFNVDLQQFRIAVPILALVAGIMILIGR